MKQSVTGSCHCGAVKFEAKLELSAPTFRCNCSVCRKSRYWLAPIPADDFRLLAGEAALADYGFGAGNIHHRFCRTCGVKPFGQAENPAFGGPFFGVNVGCLDLAPEVLAALPIMFVDGAHDAQHRAPEITSYL